jgi:hypothetical protein
VVGVLSYVGEPFKYDIFFSYPHAIQAGLKNDSDMRDWTRMVADKLLSLVAIGLSGEGTEPLSYYLDRDRMESNQSLTETLRIATQQSAILVVLMSPMYKGWCLQELGWYLEKTAQDGRGFDQVVLLEVKRTPEEQWPESLRDSARKLRVYFQVTDQHGMPIDLANFIASGPRNTPELGGPLNQIAQDLIVKLQRLRDAPRPEPKPDVPPKPPEQWVLYLEAEPPDLESWNKRRARLEPNVVLPPEWRSGSAVVGNEEPAEVYKDCDALVLLRDRPDDRIYPRIRRAYLDIRTVYQSSKKLIHWRILDNSPGTPIPGADEYHVKCIPGDDDAWPQRLIDSLRSDD